LFESILEEAQEKFDMRILAYSIMPNHWHLVLYPKDDGVKGVSHLFYDRVKGVSHLFYDIIILCQE